jgi:hypothetical protein
MIEGEPPTLQSTDSPARQGDEDREPAGNSMLSGLDDSRKV